MDLQDNTGNHTQYLVITYNERECKKGIYALIMEMRNLRDLKYLIYENKIQNLLLQFSKVFERW